MINGYLRCCALACWVLLASCGTETETGAQTSTSANANDGAEKTVGVERAAASIDAPAGVAPIIDDSAVAVLKEMTGTLAGLAEFAVTLETGFDVLQPNGQKVEFGSRRSASIRRPDKARFAYQQRSGIVGEIVLDGSEIWAYEKNQNVYASIPQEGDLDASLDFIVNELGIPVPISDFLAEDPSVALAEGVLEAQNLGPSTIDNQPSQHIALRKAGVDYQIWIADANQLPVRLVITYIDEPGQPQFWVQFLEWVTTVSSDDAVFEFSPPEDAERIRFATFDSSVAEEETP